MIKTFPLLFILLWSSAFISGDIIVQNASPFAALAFRFGIVTIGFFIFALFKKDEALKFINYANKKMFNIRISFLVKL